MFAEQQTERISSVYDTVYDTDSVYDTLYETVLFMILCPLVLLKCLFQF